MIMFHRATSVRRTLGKHVAPRARASCRHLASSSTAAAPSTEKADVASSQQAPRPTLAALKQQLLETSLQNVHKYGWTQEAIITAVMADRATASLSVAGLITPNDLIRFAMDQNHHRLQRDLKQRQTESTTSKTVMTPAGRVKQAIQLRLGYQRDYMESQTWHQAMALGASPENALQTQDQLKALIEVITRHAYGVIAVGELAKLTLGGVYVATELHMLTDKSVDYADTRAFLEQRIKEWEQATTALSSGPLADTFFVTSAVGSAFASGLASLLLPVTSTALSNLPLAEMQRTVSQAPDVLWQSLFQKETAIDPTDPRFYETNDKSM